MRRAAALLLAVAASAAFAATLDADRALAASRAAIGHVPADQAFTDADGRRDSLAAHRGRPLVVSFVYTACSEVCPTTTRFLAKAVREARAVVGNDAFDVVSIGFDPPADNPVSMRVFARQHAVDDPRWSFLTPDAAGLAPLARDFGFAYARAAGGYEHLTQVTILDASGRVHAQLHGESFALPMLVQPLRELALGLPVDPGSLTAIVDRARLLCTVYDPASGRYRFDWRLVIEIFAGLTVLGGVLAYLGLERLRARRA